MDEKTKYKVDYLISVRNDLREEIKQRIQDRNGFAIQMFVGIGAVLSIVFVPNKPEPLLLFIIPA